LSFIILLAIAVLSSRYKAQQDGNNRESKETM